jgi:hypothetical protein
VVSKQTAQAEPNVGVARSVLCRLTMYMSFIHFEAYKSAVVSHDAKQTTELVALVDFQLEALVFSNVGIIT